MTVATESSKVGATTLSCMNFFGYIKRVSVTVVIIIIIIRNLYSTIVPLGGYRGAVYSWMLTASCCLVVWLGLGLDAVSGRLVVMHTYFYYFPLSLSLSPHAYTLFLYSQFASMNIDWAQIFLYCRFVHLYFCRSSWCPYGSRYIFCCFKCPELVGFLCRNLVFSRSVVFFFEVTSAGCRAVVIGLQKDTYLCRSSRLTRTLALKWSDLTENVDTDTVSSRDFTEKDCNYFLH